MLISTYNPDSQAVCPKCGLVHCEMVGGILTNLGSRRYVKFLHRKCGTTWKVYID